MRSPSLRRHKPRPGVSGAAHTAFRTARRGGRRRAKQAAQGAQLPRARPRRLAPAAGSVAHAAPPVARAATPARARARAQATAGRTLPPAASSCTGRAPRAWPSCISRRRCRRARRSSWCARRACAAAGRPSAAAPTGTEAGRARDAAARARFDAHARPASGGFVARPAARTAPVAQAACADSSARDAHLAPLFTAHVNQLYPQRQRRLPTVPTRLSNQARYSARLRANPCHKHMWPMPRQWAAHSKRITDRPGTGQIRSAAGECYSVYFGQAPPYIGQAPPGPLSPRTQAQQKSRMRHTPPHTSLLAPLLHTRIQIFYDTSGHTALRIDPISNPTSLNSPCAGRVYRPKPTRVLLQRVWSLGVLCATRPSRSQQRRTQAIVFMRTAYC